MLLKRTSLNSNMECYALGDYVILEEDDTLSWVMLSGEVQFQGEAFLLTSIDCLVLFPYEDVSQSVDSYKIDKVWSKTKYYSIVSESGNLNFFYCADNSKVSLEEEANLSKSIGCTAKFR